MDKRLDPNDVHSYRMQATPEEILTRPGRGRIETPQKAQRELRTLYHPDLYSDLEPLFRELATKRSQDVGEAYERIRTRKGNE